MTIYNLLKTASGNFHGYTVSAFSGDVPEFEDDAEISVMENSFAGSGNFSARENSFIDSGNSVYAVTPSASEHPTPIQTLTSLPAIAAKISECHSCPLCQTRTNTVPGMGVANPLVLVVGEGPGHDEDMSGLPFVGAAGKLLDKMLIAIQLDRNKNCYIANVVKCRPPNNRTPTQEEAAACGGFLRSQIDVLKPKMILAAGRTAAQYLLQTDAPLGKLRGTFYNYSASYGDIPLLVTYHPSALLRDESNKRPAWEDLKMFKSRLLEIVPGYDN